MRGQSKELLGRLGKCELCGKTFINETGRNQKYCCKNHQAIFNARRQQERKREARRLAKLKALEKSKSIAEVVEEARAHHMSYGQWVAISETIPMLKEQGYGRKEKEND